MNFKNYFILLFIFIVSATNAQTFEVNGTVSDSKTKQPITGANVLVKSTKKGTITDMDGKYSIKLNANDALLFSNVGYASQDVKVSKSQTLNIALVEESNKLEEVVINVGYGTQKKKNLTNAVSSIKSEAFDDRPIYNIGQAIQGNAAGVNVVQPSGKPGASLDIRIRGFGSVNSGNNPLYVIDGIQTFDATGVNTEDISDIQILKDATATAIYGVNGSNGVVLITTKKGKANKNSFNFTSYFGTSKIVKNIDVLNLDQYKSLMAEISPSYVNDANNPIYAGINTNWRDKIFRTGIDQNYNFSYSGGSDKIKTFASLGYQDTKGIVEPSKFSRFSGKLNIDVDANRWLKAHASMNLIHTLLNNTSDNNSANQGGVILSTLTTPAFLPAYSEELNRINPITNLPYPSIFDTTTNTYRDGYKDGQFTPNPLASLENPVAFESRQDDTKSYRYMGNLGLDITLAKNLIWKPTSTVDFSRSVNQYFVDSYRSNYGRVSTTDPKLNGIGSETTTSKYNWNLEQTLNYTIKRGNHDLALLLGSSLQKERFDRLNISGTGFDTSLRKLDISQMMYIDRKASDTIAREKNYISYFGRATYIYKEKYIINGVIRANGASQLAKGHKWGYFPGVSAAWIISNENFLKNSSKISELKLRGGWGQAGNISGIFEYSSFGIHADDNGHQVYFNNPDLTWETITDVNIGLDLALFNNRLKFSADGFKKTSNNLIFPIYFGPTAYIYNAGKMENKGMEFSLNTINFKGDFSWNTNFNITFLKNTMQEMGMLPVETHANINGVGDAIRLQQGYSLGTFYGLQVDRVNPANGALEYKDLNGDGIISSSDRAIIGKALPDYTFGFTNNFSYKNIALDVMFTGSQGNDIFNASRIELESMQVNKNQSTVVLNRWTTPGQITDVPKAGTPSQISNRWVEDGSYVRLKAVTVGYNFKKSFLGLKSFKLYATGQNLITWTKYTGFDPEVSAFSNGNSSTSIGIDYGTYPQVKTLIFGLKAGF